ncbi:MAG: hypothetical protein U9N50_04635 [Pseudomonadota bacterium]|nr:hypothetical protein [Pseudomonadota bacterium]
MFQKKFTSLLLTSAIAVCGSIGVASAAEEPRYPPMGDRANAMPPPPGPGYNRGYPQHYPPQMGGYGRPAPYGRPMPYAGGAPYGRGAPYPPPYGGRPGGWNRGPWGGGNNGFGNMFGGNRGPYGNNSPFGNWFGGNRGPYGNNSPFGNMFGGGRDGIWGMHPDEWMTSNPEDGFSYMWDDMINAPSEMGEMPGGWNAPSISMPNPVDVGSEFRREAPNLAREIPDMINVD